MCVCVWCEQEEGEEGGYLAVPVQGLGRKVHRSVVQAAVEEGGAVGQHTGVGGGCIHGEGITSGNTTSRGTTSRDVATYTASIVVGIVGWVLIEGYLRVVGVEPRVVGVELRRYAIAGKHHEGWFSGGQEWWSDHRSA